MQVCYTCANENGKLNLGAPRFNTREVRLHCCIGSGCIAPRVGYDHVPWKGQVSLTAMIIYLSSVSSLPAYKHAKEYAKTNKRNGAGSHKFPSASLSREGFLAGKIYSFSARSNTTFGIFVLFG